MKQSQLNCLAAALCLVPALAFAEFKIDWWSFGGPGGQGTGGGWSVSGGASIGAGTASGGAFTLTGGYWSVIGGVPTPGLPRLIIERVGTDIRISWPRTAEGLILQETTTLSGAPGNPWSSSLHTPQTNATTISVTIPSPSGVRFYRLNRQ